MDRNRKTVLGIIGVAAGGVIGLVAGLLLAPKQGAQSRADIRRVGGVWKSKAGAKAAELTKSCSASLGKVRQTVGPAVASVRESGAPGATRIGAQRAGATTGKRDSDDEMGERREETS